MNRLLRARTVCQGLRGLPWMAWLFVVPAARGHEGSAAVLADLGKRIVAQPDEPELFLRRGHLLAVSGALAAASADAHRAAELGGNAAEIAFLRGCIAFRAGSPAAACRELNVVLADFPRHMRALRLRAMAAERLQDWAGALADWDRLISEGRPPDPDAVLARLRLTEQAAGSGAPAALAWAERHLDNHPTFPALEAELSRLQAACGAWDRLHARLDRAISHSARPAALWLQKARYLRLEGRLHESVEPARRCLASLHSLPASAAQRPAMLAMEDEAAAICNGEKSLTLPPP